MAQGCFRADEGRVALVLELVIGSVDACPAQWVPPESFGALRV